MRTLIDLLDKLEEKKIFFKLGKIRESILIEIAVPGERWEVEFFADESIQVERFISVGDIGNQDELELLFTSFSD